MSKRSKICDLAGCLWAAILIVAVWGCSKDPGVDEWIDDNTPSGETLSLSTGSSFTRADGFDQLNPDPHAEQTEEAIHRVDLFFFSGSAAPESDASPFYFYETTINQTTKADLTVKLPIEMASQFGSDKKAYVYALVNLPESVSKATLQGLSSYGSLQELWVSAPEFATNATAPADFVMRGGAPITLVETNNTVMASGTVLLERLASKIRLWAQIPQHIYIDTESGKTVNEGDPKWNDRETDETVEKWESVPGSGADSNVEMYLYNLTTKGRIDAFLGDELSNRPDEQLSYANIDQSGRSENDPNPAVRRLAEGVNLPAADKDETYTYSHVPAYYSYPNVWDTSTLEEQHATYLIIRLPWRRVEDAGAEYENFYYQIPVNALQDGTAKMNRLDPNRYYRIKLRVGMLGSKDLGSPLELEASCEVLPWQTADVDVAIKGRRYLVVNQTEWTMNNESMLEIPFSSSHKIEVEKCYVNYFRYNDVWGTADYTDGEHNATEFGNWVDAAGKTDGVGKAGEGLITASFNTIKSEYTTNRVGIGRYEGITTNTVYNYKDEQLYYKSEYFNDPYIGYTYYVGHEHPITFQQDYVKYESHKDKMTKDEQQAWQDYIDKYGIDAIYTHEIDEEKGVIRFTHPLIQWKGVRNLTYRGSSGRNRTGSRLEWGRYWTYYTVEETYDSEFQYYAPELNPRTGRLWDEFSRCEIILKIKHKDWTSDDDLYRETIHITQYPAVYVNESHNYGSISTEVQSGLLSGYGGGNEYVRINGLTTYNYNATLGDWEIDGQGIFGVTNSVTKFNGTNMNPNMYVIHISQLSEEDEILYDIGDPRSLVSNLLASESNDALDNSSVGAWKSWYGSSYRRTNDAPVKARSCVEGVVGDSRTLNYYYPTDETTEGQPGSKENFVAPVLRIASSFGKIQQLQKFEARRRCAAYQEAGRPAGRWRLPTKAEVKYVASLSRDGKIPILFGLPNDDAQYWTATGIVNVDANLNVSDATPGSTDAVRCVYDDWYWIKTDGSPDLTPKAPLEEDFYWGDKEKDNTQNQVQSLVRTRTNKK